MAGDYRAVINSLGKSGAAFFAWWGRELAACVPQSVRRILLPPRTKLIIEIKRQGALELTKLTPDGRERVATVAPRAERLSPGEQSALKELTGEVDQVVVSLPESCGVRRRVELPAAAGENLREVLAMEMDRLTPFRTDDIYFACDQPEPGHSKDQIAVNLTIVPKALADEVLHMARSVGLEPDMLALGADDKFDRNLLGSMVSSGRRLPRFFANSYAVAIVLLLIAASILPFEKQQQAITALEQKIAAAGETGLEAAAMQQKLAAWQEASRRIASYRRQSPAVIALLDELSAAIPSGTWIEELDVSQKPSRLVVSGYSDNAPALIANLESLDLLQGVKFDEPVAFDDMRERDRFRLSAEIVAVSTVPTQ